MKVKILIFYNDNTGRKEIERMNQHKFGIPN